CVYGALRGSFELPSAQVELPIGTPLLDQYSGLGTRVVTDADLQTILAPGAYVQVMCDASGTRWTSGMVPTTWPKGLDPR
ncbi:hypothetical protein, partial [Streptococcus pneumoniae]|uniref:hypothetical protein n=1 Tax=Streptococcus pneumoniae TaxID=1313 RepID=UPI0018B07FBC